MLLSTLETKWMRPGPNTPTISVFGTEKTMNLAGVLEWVNTKGGTVKSLCEYIFCGEIKGFRYRYFTDEGFIGVYTPECPEGFTRAYYSLPEFIKGYDKDFKL